MIERYAGPIRLVPSPEGVQTQGMNAQGQWENLVRATEDNTMPGVRPGSDQFFASQVQGLPGFVPDSGTGQEPSNGGGFGGFMNDYGTLIVGGALGGIAAGAAAAGGGAAASGGTGAGAGFSVSPAAEAAAASFGGSGWAVPAGLQAAGAAGGLSALELGEPALMNLPAVGGPIGGGAVPAVGATGAGTAASSAGALSRIMNGTATAADYLSIGAPLAGALLGSQNGAKQAGTTTTVQDIPDWQKPYVLDLFNKANATYNASQGQQPQNQALVDAGRKQLTDTINGNYLSPDSNPYLKGMFNAGADQITNKVNSQFTASGRYGSGAQTGELGYQLGNFANNLYGNAYQTGRQQQLTAATAAPGYAASAATSPFAGLEAYGNIVGNRFGSQTQSPYFTNPTGGALSGALAGYGLSRAFG